jgi:hypothetical protein
VDHPWLPSELGSGPFSVADARAIGMPWGRLRAPHLHTPTKAVRTPRPPSTVTARATAFAVALPQDIVFSHVTAAQLWGLSLPDEVCAQLVLDVMRHSDRTPVRRVGCRGHRGLESRSVTRRAGLPVTSLADTWVDLGELTMMKDGHQRLTLDDLVVLGDEVATRLIGPPEPGATPNSPQLVDSAVGLLGTALEGRVRARGGMVLAEALRLVRAPVRSPMETRARLMFVRSGFPEPRVNLPVYGDDDGQWLLEGDLVWERERVIGEYQGKDHASIRRRSLDAARARTALDEGWRILEIYADDVYRPPRRRACLHGFAGALGLDLGTLRIT